MIKYIGATFKLKISFQNVHDLKKGNTLVIVNDCSHLSKNLCELLIESGVTKD